VVKNLNYTGRKHRTKKKADIKNKNAGGKSQEHRALVFNAILKVISNVFGVSPDKVTDSPDTRKAFVNAVNDLRGREVMAIMLRAIGMSYRGAGKAMGVSGARARYNEAKGLRKLRRPDRIAFMQEYVRRNTCDAIFPASKIQFITPDYTKIWPITSGQQPFLRNETQ
jgi:hypothetical protein